jgi:hypothetical protein
MSRPRRLPGAPKATCARFMPIWRQMHLLPAQHLVDSGYVTVANLVQTQTDHGADLVGPTLKTHWYQAETGYDLTHFSIDWDAETVACPQGRISSSWTPVQDAGKALIKIKFSISGCKVCPSRASCTGTMRRSLTLHRKRAHAGAACRAPAGGDRGVQSHLSPSGGHRRNPFGSECAPWGCGARAISVCAKPIWATWRLPPPSMSFN